MSLETSRPTNQDTLSQAGPITSGHTYNLDMGWRNASRSVSQRRPASQPLSLRSSIISLYRKKTLTERDHRLRKRIVTRDKRSLLPQIAVDSNEGPSASVSVRIVLRTLNGMDFCSRRLAHVLLLTPRHKALGLACAQLHLRWTLNDWENVV
ncbi:HTH_Tnp_Tc3_2 domain-containing protein [Trichonephila clavipes]|nr:HTH_Tnp_Tc3_2 domain-containing protein [Trichonephila clavipes]